MIILFNHQENLNNCIEQMLVVSNITIATLVIF